MKVVIDMDDTLVNLKDHLKYVMKERFGVSITDQERSKFYLEKVLQDQKGMNHEQAINEMLDIFSEKDFFLKLEPNEGAVDVIKCLCDTRKFDIIISSRVPIGVRDAFTQKMDWLRKYFSDEFRKEILFAYLTDSSMYKGLLAKNGILIDDKVKEAVGAKKHGAYPIIYNQPWNKVDPKRTLTDFYARVKNWEEVYSLLLFFREWDTF